MKQEDSIVIPVYNDSSDEDVPANEHKNAARIKIDILEKETTVALNHRSIAPGSESEYEDEEDDEEEEEEDKEESAGLMVQEVIEPVVETNAPPSNKKEHTPPLVLKKKSIKDVYTKLEGINYIATPNFIYIGLRNNEKLFVVGHMNFKIVKGGLIYNMQHFNASAEKNYNIHHPAMKSVAPLKGSYYASFKEQTFISAKELSNINNQVYEEYYNTNLPSDGFNVNEYQTILKIPHSNDKSNINDINLLSAKYQNVWKSLNNKDYMNGFQILSLQELEHFKELEIPEDWTATLKRLMVKFHDPNNTMQRIMIIGGKNSGKSTLNKILLQNFLYSSPSTSLNYIDLDAGQPEFSTPNCVSCSEVRNGADCILGDPLIQRNAFPESRINMIKEVFLGSANPNLFPVSYLSTCTDIIDTMFQHDLFNPTLINLPGWVKGFGIEVLQSILAAYKPTDLIVLESSRQSMDDGLFNDLNLHSLSRFYINEDTSHNTTLYRLHGIFKDANKNIIQHQWHASHIREYKLLTYLHEASQKGTFDFTPLVQQVPRKISFLPNTITKGKSGIIRGIKFLNTLGIQDINASVLEAIVGTLQGSVVGLHGLKRLADPALDTDVNEITYTECSNKKIPIIESISNNADLEFLCLAVIHSINLDESFMNVYVHESYADRLEHIISQKNLDLIIVKGSVELPTCELLPENGCLVKYINQKNNSKLPSYVSTNKKRKMNDSVWKSRNNILRRGQIPEK